MCLPSRPRVCAHLPAGPCLHLLSRLPCRGPGGSTSSPFPPWPLARPEAVPVFLPWTLSAVLLFFRLIGDCSSEWRVKVLENHVVRLLGPEPGGGSVALCTAFRSLVYAPQPYGPAACLGLCWAPVRRGEGAGRGVAGPSCSRGGPRPRAARMARTQPGPERLELLSPRPTRDHRAISLCPVQTHSHRQRLQVHSLPSGASLPREAVACLCPPSSPHQTRATRRRRQGSGSTDLGLRSPCPQAQRAQQGAPGSARQHLEGWVSSPR